MVVSVQRPVVSNVLAILARIFGTTFITTKLRVAETAEVIASTKILL